jgi:predicted cupin superfamily sugar epimerase
MAIVPPTANDLIQLLALQPLVGEGGYYRQTVVVPDPDQPHAPRHTAILYLITADTWSALHRLEGDELFHFYMGDPCRQVIATPGQAIEERILGHDVRSGHVVQSLVPGGTWQATRLAEGGQEGYALLGTTMTPGFRADQFTLASTGDLGAFDPVRREALLPFLASSS